MSCNSVFLVLFCIHYIFFGQCTWASFKNFVIMWPPFLTNNFLLYQLYSNQVAFHKSDYVYCCLRKTSIWLVLINFHIYLYAFKIRSLFKLVCYLLQQEKFLLVLKSSILYLPFHKSIFEILQIATYPFLHIFLWGEIHEVGILVTLNIWLFGVGLWTIMC